MEKINKILQTNPKIKPKTLYNKIETEKKYTDIARKVIRNYLIGYRRNNNKDDKLYKNTIAGINKWMERHCNSDDVEELDDGNKLIVHKHIASPTNVMMLIAAKNVLKLLQKTTFN